LLPDREIATVASFLAGHRTIEVLSRDRGGGYREAGAKALPSAVQVADRWHLMENASAAFLDAVRKSMRSIRAAIGATTIDPKLLTATERLQYEGFLRREDANIAILALHKDGVPIKEIMRRLGYSRGLVRKVIRGCVRTFSGHEKARLIHICSCSTRSGTAVAATAPNCGAG
jgi:transposase